MRTPEDIYTDFYNRRKGILKALTQDVDKFYANCDPERENLCLYGLSDGSWEVDLPAEEVPPEMPEPALGINFARDGMQRRDWLALVAVHSDTWLISVAYYNGARLNKDGREKLFELINSLPTCYEIVSGKASGVVGSKNAQQQQQQQQMVRKRVGPPLTGKPGTKLRQDSSKMMNPSGRPGPKHEADEEDDDEEDAVGPWDKEYGDGEGDPCPNCGRVYRTGDFWIQCDFCDTWYDGKCVQMTPQKAQKLGKWKCPACLRQRA